MSSTRLYAGLLALALPLGAQAKRPITPQDLWAMKRVGAPALSPDGARAVFPVQEWSIEKNKATANLWIVDLAGGEPRRLTTAQASDGSPAWSPDGSRIAFVSKRGEDEAAALYVLPLGGGEAQKVLDWPFAVSAPHWMPDGKGLVVATTVLPELAGSLAKADLAAMAKEAKRRRESKMTAKATENRQYRYFDHWMPEDQASRLLKVDVETKAVTDLTPGWKGFFSVSGEAAFDLSPDGRSVVLAANTTPPPYRDFLNTDLLLFPTNGSGTAKNLTPENRAFDGSPRFMPDGKAILYARHAIPYYCGEFTKLWRHDLASGRNTPLTQGLDYGIESFEPTPDGSLWITAEDRGVVPLFRLKADGTGLEAVHAKGTVSGVDAKAGRVIFLHDTTDRPAELFTLDPASGAPRQLTHFNDAKLAELSFGKVERYTFAGAKGAQIQGWIIYPPDYDPAKPYPLVQAMHGGPHTMVRDSWSYRWNSHVFAAPGYVVTWVNRHGSTSFGEAFSRSIQNQWGDMPFEDIMKATDLLLKQHPNLDRNRMAAIGASYGGYMAAWVLGHTDRFKAIVDHAGVNSSYAQYATDVPHGFPEVMGGKAWDNVEGMQKENPMAYAKHFKTPTLITHGEIDYRVPYGNGLELYGVLQAMGVPSRLVLFPNENHWFLSPQNAIYWNWEVQAWLGRYLGGKPTLEKPRFEGEAK